MRKRRMHFLIYSPCHIQPPPPPSTSACTFDIHLLTSFHSYLPLLSHIMQIRTQQLRPLHVIPPIQLLIHTVRRIRAAPHRQQQHILPRRPLKRQRHGDTSPLARQIGLDAEHRLRRPARGRVVPVAGRGDPPVPRVEEFASVCVFGAEFGEFG